MGLLVEYEVNLLRPPIDSSTLTYLSIAEPDELPGVLDELMAGVTSAAVMKLPSLEVVRWALLKPEFRLQPDYGLLLDLKSFGIYPVRASQRDVGLHMEGVLHLTHLETDSPIYSTSFSLTSSRVYKRWEDPKQLDWTPFYDEFAVEVARIVAAAVALSSTP